jgi:cytochrome c peroxidase
MPKNVRQNVGVEVTRLTPGGGSQGSGVRRLIRRFALGLVLVSSAVPALWAGGLRVDILPRFDGLPLMFDSLTNTIATGQRVSVTRLDFLVSQIGLRRADGSWLELTNSLAFISARQGRTSFQVENVPNGQYDGLCFLVGLPSTLNHQDAASFPANHPLNPEVNGLHWSWMGGYVFFALEGGWLRGDGQQSGYSYHIATDRQLMRVNLPVAIDLFANAEVSLALNVDRIFSTPKLSLNEETAGTHSRANDVLAGQLRRAIEGAFTVQKVGVTALAVSETGKVGVTASAVSPIKQPSSERLKPSLQPIVEIAASATPYRLKISRFFPRPALPLDNPLTEEGVELGRRLFFDPVLSINNGQACAACHAPQNAFTDRKPVSPGAEGKVGNRNAMALLNLAWKSSFFWDGRAASLREQVLQPIQNPIEMHESLTNVVAKLSRTANYPTAFEAAFGTGEVNADRVARALEQFLLTEVSHNSKFDRVLNGESQFTSEEQRGFELFHTEYDPRREQFGADCFHCHGGPLFQSQSFANNGLDAQFSDSGRYEATHKAGDLGKFAVPSLRNTAVTGPYMHDGRFTTLEEVVEHYSTEVKRTATLDPNLAKHPDGGVPLSTADKRALVVFLKTLTDEKFMNRDAVIAKAP